MNRFQKQSLLPFVPEELQLLWATKEGIRPRNCDWRHTVGPSAEVGRAILKGADVTTAACIIATITNPEVLREVAQRDKRVGVAKALIESEHLPADAFSTLMEKFSIGQLLPGDQDSNNLKIDYGVACAAHQDHLDSTVWNSVKKLGYIGALDQVLDLVEQGAEGSSQWRHEKRCHALRTLLSPQKLLEKGSLPAEEYLNGVLHFLNNSDKWVGSPSVQPRRCLPTASILRSHCRHLLADGWCEHIVRTAVELEAPAAQMFGAHPVHSPVKDIAEVAEFTGDLPDLSHLMKSGDEARRVALAARAAWSHRDPVTLDEVRDEVWSFHELHRTKIVLTSEAANYLWQIQGLQPHHSKIEIFDPFGTINRCLNAVENGADNGSEDPLTLLEGVVTWISRNGAGGSRAGNWQRLINMSSQLLTVASRLDAQDAVPLCRASRELVECIPGSAWSGEALSRWELLNRKVLLDISFGEGTDRVGRKIALALLFPSSVEAGHANLYLDVVEQLATRDVSNDIWANVLERLPYEYQIMVHHKTPGRFTEILYDGPEFEGSPAVYDYAVEAYTQMAFQGDTAVAAAFLEAYDNAGHTRPGRLLDFAPSEGVEHWHVQTLSGGQLSRMLEPRLGADPTLWQLALELAADWDGDVESYLDTLSALTEQ